MSEQQDNLDRVTARIGAMVIRFCGLRGVGKQFYAGELRRYIRATVGEVAPGSPDRVLRNLRQRGFIGYKVISRHESLYEVLRVGKAATA